MKIYRLAEYANAGALTDLEDARFFARRLGPDACLDFAGVTFISAEFLDVLLAGRLPESLPGRLARLSGQVEQALVAWQARHHSSPGTAMPPMSVPVVPLPSPPLPRAVTPFESTRAEPQGERYTPTQLVRRLREQLQRYIESAYPLSDPVLVRSRRRLLEQDQGGHLLAQEPYLETNPRYRASTSGYDGLRLPEHTAELFLRLAVTPQQRARPGDGRTILFPSLYEHQAEAYRCFLVDGRDILVATGTGSGKTECFLVPVLGNLYDEALLRPESFARAGVRVLILYPMNALVNDQLARLRLLFGDENVAGAFRSLGEGRRHPTFGMYTGRTPYPGPRDPGRDRERVAPLLEYYLGMDEDLRQELQRLGRYPAKDLEAFYGRDQATQQTYTTGRKAGQPFTRHHFDRRLRTQPGDRELLTRQEMVRDPHSQMGQAPDILVTNYSMLEYMLMRPFERPIFAQTAEWLQGEGNQFLLVLDEAHMYRGAKGAEVGFLLRRLRARLGINDRPDKLRVICTSASLGTSAGALDTVRRFAADLTGKDPNDFVALTGQREVPVPAGPGSPDLGDRLAAIDLDDVHAPSNLERVRAALAPLLDFLGQPCPAGDEIDLWRQVRQALAGQPVINLLLQETAGRAQSLPALAEQLFPNHALARKATEVLVTLGAMARDRPDNPGLVPTRVHAFFRGLHALYACINPRCSGRQDGPGEEAVLGKLFSESRVSCDACGARVFELASCRACGSPYLLAYCPPDRLGSLDFLWGETEGNLQVVQLLPQPPRYGEQAEELNVHFLTGFLDRDNTLPAAEVRPMWLAHGAQGREAAFPRCALCQPNPRSRARITDFRTRGEQPFTALIDAQFAEQPPQNDNPTLANRGRKVLVFSDGRQKAARLAPALEHSHARDLFRQVLGLAARELATQTGHTGMHLLYPAVLWVCQGRRINLFPSPDENVFADHLLRARDQSLEDLIRDFNQGLLRPTLSYARQLFSEMTDRYYSLNALGLATVEENPCLRTIFHDFPSVGLAEAEVLVLIRSWLRLQLEERRFLPPGADISNLGEGWERPEGMDARKPGQVVPPAFQDYLQCVLGGKGPASDVEHWFINTLVRRSGLLRLQNDVYFLEPEKLSLNLRLEEHWLRCRDCSRLYHEVFGERCPACLGAIIQADPDYLDARAGFYRQQMWRAFSGRGVEPFSLTAAEHSAQLTGKDDQEAFTKTETYELRFQDIAIADAPPIDVLSCTTTMEVGIDIGQLCGVALRNVPPHVANYQQRSGRAGRRGRAVASVVTYAHGTSHDAQYYESPGPIISGDVRPPVVYIENQQVLRRHVNAYLVQRFFHEQVRGEGQDYSLFASLGTVEQFLSGHSPCSLEGLRSWLQIHEDELVEEVRRWAPRHSHGLDETIPEVERTITTAVPALLGDLGRTLPVQQYGQRAQLEGPVREGLEQQLSEQLLETLIEKAIFPRYAFPTSVVSFWVSRRKIRGDPPHRRFFDYEPQRDLQIALTEYAPGAELTIDKYRFASAAVYSPYAAGVRPMLQRARNYTACKTCGYMSLREETIALVACPCCGGPELIRQRFIVPEGFAPDINVRREVDRGDSAEQAGRATRAQIEVQEPPAVWDAELSAGRIAVIARPQELVTVNKGIGDRGFMVCPECGRTEPVFGPGFTQPTLFRAGRAARHPHPLEQGQFCDGTALGPYFLGHYFPTDVLLFRLRTEAPVLCPTADEPGLSGRPGRIALTSLVEAIGLTASRELQIDEGELAGNWCPIPAGSRREVYLFLYDLLPGGAGYTRLVLQNLVDVVTATEGLLAGCTCESSCYRCLRHFGNNYLHASLDRHLALALLRHLLHGERPALPPEQERRALGPLVEFLRLKGLRSAVGVERAGQAIPLVVTRPGGGEIWVNIYHPLMDPEAANPEVQRLAESEMAEFCVLDSFTLIHDLPAAVAALQL